MASREADELLVWGSELGELVSARQMHHTRYPSRVTRRVFEFAAAAVLAIAMACQFELTVTALWLDFNHGDATERLFLMHGTAQTSLIVRDVAGALDSASLACDWPKSWPGSEIVESMSAQSMLAWPRALGSQCVTLRCEFVPDPARGT